MRCLKRVWDYANPSLGQPTAGSPTAVERTTPRQHTRRRSADSKP